MSREFNTNLNCSGMDNYKLKKKFFFSSNSFVHEILNGKSEQNDFLSRVLPLLEDIKKLRINILK